MKSHLFFQFLFPSTRKPPERVLFLQQGAVQPCGAAVLPSGAVGKVASLHYSWGVQRFPGQGPQTDGETERGPPTDIYCIK